MDFSLEYTEEQEAFAVEVRQWLDENVPKGLEPIRDVTKMSEEQWQLRRDFFRTLGKKGWLYPTYPKAYGGCELSGSETFVLHKEVEKKELTIPPLSDVSGLCAATVLAIGNEEQKNEILPAICTGEVLTWQLFTETEAGTDAANQQTDALRSQREKDHFIINGHKVFIGSYPSKPEQFYLLTRSDPDGPRHQNLSSFVIPADLPGITVQALDLFPLHVFQTQCVPTGARAEGVKHAIYFDNVRVHESHLLGKEGQGWQVTSATLEVEHGGGRSSRGGPVPENYMTERFLARCNTDPQVNRRLKENPQLQDSVLEIYIDTQIQRLLTMRNVDGKGGYYGGPQLALFNKMLGTRYIKHMANVLGPIVYIDEDEPTWGIENGMYECGQRSGICLAPGGTPEALKINISRALSMGR